MIQWCVEHRIKVVLATVGVFALSIVGFGHVQQQFFPLSERPELFLQLRLPEGTAFGVTEKSVKKAEALLKGDKDISTYTAYVGQGSPRFWLGLSPQLPNEAFAEIVIVAKDVEARERIKARIEKAVDDGALTEARVRVDRFNFGPPVGFPVQFRVIGPDPAKVREIAYKVRDVVRQNDKVKDPQLDWNEQSPYLKLVVDQDRARALGLTPQDVSQALSMLISGAPVTTVRDGIEKVGVVARAVPSERLDLAHVGDLTVTSRNGVAVPLLQIAKIEYAHEEPIMWRRNRDMAITVRGDVVDGVQAPDVTNQIWPKLQDIRDHLEPAYRIEAGGAFEESAKGNASIFVLFPLMVIVMLTLLMIQLQSFSRLILVFLTAPLGIIGASLGPERRQPAVRLRGAARIDRAGRHDHAQCGDSGGPDRNRRRPRSDPQGGHRRGHRPARPSGGADGARRDPGDDPAVALGVLGPDGDHHHGRLVRCNLPDLAVPAGPLRPLVPQQP